MPRLPIDYSKTVMYKIVCNDLNIKDLYVGHTTNFIRRKEKHKSVCKLNSCDYKIYKTIRDNGGWDNWTMLELEKYPCIDGNEASLRERYWYEQLNSTLNILHPGRTTTEISTTYYTKNKEKILASQKLYCRNNKAKIYEYMHTEYICECGKAITKLNKSRHLKTKKHFEMIEKLKINI